MKKWMPILVTLLTTLGCEEHLPARIVPQNTLEITDLSFSQGIHQSGPYMEFIITIANGYEETFQAEVEVNGHLVVWWKNRPEVHITLPVDNRHFAPPSQFSGQTLTIDAGGRCLLKLYWYLSLGDGRSLLDLLDYSGSVPAQGLITAKPEIFVVEAEIKLFDQTGYLPSKRLSFTFTGIKQIPLEAGFTPKTAK
ncbi:MAG TPA: hypothetical protein PLO28_09935 [bacterium]|nr:hypothetical protein [bacterium]